MNKSHRHEKYERAETSPSAEMNQTAAAAEINEMHKLPAVEIFLRLNNPEIFRYAIQFSFLLSSLVVF